MRAGRGAGRQAPCRWLRGVKFLASLWLRRALMGRRNETHALKCGAGIAQTWLGGRELQGCYTSALYRRTGTSIARMSGYTTSGRNPAIVRNGGNCTQSPISVAGKTGLTLTRPARVARPCADEAVHRPVAEPGTGSANSAKMTRSSVRRTSTVRRRLGGPPLPTCPCRPSAASAA